MAPCACGKWAQRSPRWRATDRRCRNRQHNAGVSAPDARCHLRPAARPRFRLARTDRLFREDRRVGEAPAAPPLVAPRTDQGHGRGRMRGRLRCCRFLPGCDETVTAVAGDATSCPRRSVVNCHLPCAGMVALRSATAASVLPSGFFRAADGGLKSLKPLADPTRFERATFAFGGQFLEFA